jgi:glycosyltransferase involved in cell wall biosynthesis
LSRLDVAIYAPFAGDLYGRIRGRKGSGGAELQTVLLATGLARRGARVGHIVFPIETVGELDPNLELIQRPAFELGERFRAPRELRVIWEALSRADPAVVIVRGSGRHMIPISAWAFVHRRPLIFATSNDLDFDLQRPDRSRLNLKAYALAARHAARLVVQTDTQQRLAAQTFPKLPSRVIPSFAEASSPSGASPEYFLWSDRMTEYKRPDAFLDLVAALPESRFRMIASPTDETTPELLQRIEERAAKLPNLEMLERCSRSELLAQIGAAIALVKTSEVEGMPNTFLESWAQAVPVVSLSVDPDARIADHGGGIVAGGDPQAFIDAARRLSNDPGLRAELGANGRAFVTSHHSIDAVIERWLAVIGELTDLPGVRSRNRSESPHADAEAEPGSAPAAKS